MTGKTDGNADTENGNNNAHSNSCSALDLSWLNESVLEAALDMKHLRLRDVDDFHQSLRAAEEFGSMDHDVSERLHQKIESRKSSLVGKMVNQEAARVTKRLGLFPILKAHASWMQVHYMADMHGQGAYISMAEFQGLGKEQVGEAMAVFNNQLELTGKLPYTPEEEAKDIYVDETARTIVETKVAEKLCRAYLRLYKSLMDPQLGGYDQEFLKKCLQYTPEELANKLGVSSVSIQDASQDDREIMAEIADDEL